MTKKRRKLKTGDQEVKRKKIDDPNPESEDFIYNDIDKFHRSKDKILLNPNQEEESDIDEIEDEEVLGVIDSDDDSEDGSDESEADAEEEDENEDGSDDEDMSDDDDILQKKQADLPSDKAWGKNKKSFYNTDMLDEDVYASDEEAEIAAEEEEKEAIMLQKRMAQNLDADDFYTVDENFINKENDEEEDETTVTKDLSKLSKKEKLELLSKESPELLPLLDDYKETMEEAKEIYHPLLSMCNEGYIKHKQAVLFIETKHQLLMNYMVNISFYLALKANKEETQGHPICDVLVQHKELLDNMQGLDEKLMDTFGDLLVQYKNGELENKFTAVQSKERTNKQKKGKSSQSEAKKRSSKNKGDSDSNNDSSDSSEDENEAGDDNENKITTVGIDPLEYYNMIKRQTDKAKQKQTTGEDDEENELFDDNMNEDEKRQITYEMSKNKGLIRKRRKELKNPRVKHKVKYKKAKIKHKGQVREVKPETMRYGGERTGIKSNLTKSVKIKY